MKTMTMGLIAALVAIGGAASAGETVINKQGMTGPEVVAWLQSVGYRAELAKDKVGDPMVRSAASGKNFEIYFYDCEKERCKALQFSAGFDLETGLPAAKANEWNQKFRYLKVYLDEENDPYVQYDVNVNEGRPIAALSDDFSVWTGTLPDFIAFIDW